MMTTLRPLFALAFASAVGLWLASIGWNGERASASTCTPSNPTLQFEFATFEIVRYFEDNDYGVRLECEPSDDVKVNMTFPDSAPDGFYFRLDYVPQAGFALNTRYRPFASSMPSRANYEFTIKKDNWNKWHGVSVGYRKWYNPHSAGCPNISRNVLWQKDWGADFALVNTLTVGDSASSITQNGPTLTYTEPTSKSPPDCMPWHENRHVGETVTVVHVPDVTEGETIRITFSHHTGRWRSLDARRSMFYFYSVLPSSRPQTQADVDNQDAISKDGSFPLVGRLLIPKEAMIRGDAQYKGGTDEFSFDIPTVCRDGDQGDVRLMLELFDRSLEAAFPYDPAKGPSHLQFWLDIADNGLATCPQGNHSEPLFYPSAKISGAAVTIATQDSIGLSWDRSLGATGYEVRYRKSGSSGDWYSVTTDQPTILISGLQPLTMYDVQVFPIARAATGGWLGSPTLSASTTKPVYPTPRLRNVTVGKRTHESIALSWPAIEGAESYQIRYWMEDKKSKTSKRLTVTSASATLENLKANRRYIIRVGYVMDGELVSGKVSEQITAKTRKAPQ